MRALFTFATATVLMLFTSPSISARALTSFDSNDLKIEALIAQMTLDEKVSLVGGTGFDSRPLTRLGIPAIAMTDGPLGVRWGRATAFPSGISLGASFDPALLHKVGEAIADEALDNGRNMLLGPCVNISRNPFGGRNFESYGEDPYLTGMLAAEYIKGVQSRNVLTSVKHFAANDQEWQRMTIDARVPLRALFEIHLPAFKVAIDSGAWTVMAAYNKINGQYATENSFLLNKVLKDMWGFKGFVVSDWGATHSTIDAALNGLDLEMPTAEFFDSKLTDAVHSGQVSEVVLDDKVRRILRAMYGIGLLGPSQARHSVKSRRSKISDHRALALQVAQQSIVLLKNDALLPLGLTRPLKSIAVLGPNASEARTGGGGSSHVTPVDSSTPLDGIKSRFGANAKVRFAVGAPLPGSMDTIPTEDLRPQSGSLDHGLNLEIFKGRELTGEPILKRLDPQLDFDVDLEDPAVPREEISARWGGEVFAPFSGRYTISTSSDDGIRVFIDDSEVISNWTPHASAVNSTEIEFVAGTWHSVRVEYFNAEGGGIARLGWVLPHDDKLQEAIELARTSDTAIIFAGLGNDMESEGIDRETMALPPGQVELIKAVAQVNRNTVVVLNSGNPLPMGEWINDVKAVLQAWYPGQEGGFAIADILSGAVNPSAKLPVSFLKRWEDSPAFGNYPGHDGYVEYQEGIFVGYRHYDIKNITPEFPFGHGLSYTTFDYSNLSIHLVDDSTEHAHARVEFDLKNSGAVTGAEVAQLYVGEQHPSLPRPIRELKGFKKLLLQPGETKHVAIDLDPSSFAYFDVPSMSWKVNPGLFKIDIGSSSRDLRLTQNVVLKQR